MTAKNNFSFDLKKKQFIGILKQISIPLKLIQLIQKKTHVYNWDKSCVTLKGFIRFEHIHFHILPPFLTFAQ